MAERLLLVAHRQFEEDRRGWFDLIVRQSCRRSHGYRLDAHGKPGFDHSRCHGVR